MIRKKKEFYGGLGLFVAFLVILVIVFSPVFGGQNALEYLDSLYNSISKGSAYYVPDVKKESEKFLGNRIEVSLKMKDSKEADEVAVLFRASGADATIASSELKISGDLGKILEGCLADCDAMYHNKGDRISGKYGRDEKKALYHWWQAFKAMDKGLKKEKKFKEADVVALANKKAVETSYNYYGIQPQKVTERLGTVIFSLVFYVIYTLWYGFAIMFMFEGWGLRLGH
ncbi:MAG: hypothetical protein JW821_12055 [Deltaproteobacteria bacterium]|nr:hypothetical protein [Deltaproteobacteria bacterium]